MFLDLPTPERCELTSSLGALTDPNDAAASSPISVPTQATLTLQVVFSDGTRQDFSSDSRGGIVADHASVAQGCIEERSGRVQLVQAGAIASNCRSVKVNATTDVGRFGEVLPMHSTKSAPKRNSFVFCLGSIR